MQVLIRDNRTVQLFQLDQGVVRWNGLLKHSLALELTGFIVASLTVVLCNDNARFRCHACS
jgi:hypothetical protein